MQKETWSRRELLRTGAIAAGGATITSLLNGRKAMAQLPKPQPLNDPAISLVTTTESQPWQKGSIFSPAFDWTILNLNLGDASPQGAAMQGFGACFSELGWTSLEALSEADREAVMTELFDPKAGTRFTYCRTPIASSDFALDGYTYDETDGDFELEHFSIDHDRKTLVPFIKAALKHQPDLKLWACPWTPPTWMKRNHFYAEAKALPVMGMKDNGIRPDQVGHEGEDMFIQEPKYFDAYARYFGKYIDAYRAEGINVGMVMQQNEFNSAQNFPSCTWTPEGLARFIQHLGPEMEKRGVEVFFGTLERPNTALMQKVMEDAEAARFVKGIGLQWAGKGALPAAHEKYPDIVVFHSEQECGDGQNAWSYTSYCWQLMKHYLRSGASGYMYWNVSLKKDARSTWGWPQNSLVTVDEENKTYRFNHDFYLLKHLTHFVDVGAKRVNTTGTCDDALAFRNPDGEIVVLLRNELAHPQLVQVQLPGRQVLAELPPDSVATMSVQPG